MTDHLLTLARAEADRRDRARRHLAAEAARRALARQQLRAFVDAELGRRAAFGRFVAQQDAAVRGIAAARALVRPVAPTAA